MNERIGSTESSGAGNKPLPPPYTPVLVRCKDYRCQAYRDHSGKWHGSKTREELPEVLEVFWEP
jgi:hypothetical protein